MLSSEELDRLLSSERFKTAEDAEAAGRLVARGYADEMRKLAKLFGENEEEPDEEAEETEEDEEIEEDEETEESEMPSEEDLLWLVQQMGI